MHSIFSIFSYNIGKSNLKLPYFYFDEIVLNAYEAKEHKEPESLWGQSEIQCLMLDNGNLISIKKFHF